MGTAHNSAEKGMIFKTVLMSGDPLRAKYIADTYLDDVTCFNTVRNMFGYSGYYHGKPVSVMGSGMGMPSIGIYSYELFTYYDVDVIIRIGSAGSYSEKANVNDVILVTHAYSESSYAKVQSGYEGDVLYPDKELNAHIKACADNMHIPLIESGIHSSDVFYREDTSAYFEAIRDEHDCIGVEMESFALFHNANVLHKKAACLLTISDSFVSDVQLSAEAREQALDTMIKVALEAVTND